MISTPDLTYEKRFWQSGFKVIAGLDEAGRGALAGPVAVAAVILPHDHPHLARTLAGARDSKQMTPLARDRLAPRIREIACAWGLGFASSEEIDSLSIVTATRLAALRALECIHVTPEYLLTDFRLELPELDISQTALVRGDQCSLSIAAASILAKTARDEFMCSLDREYPQYGFAHHKGYGTERHCQMIGQIGRSPVHRKTFDIKQLRIT